MPGFLSGAKSSAVAVLECTSRKLLPQKYRDADRTELVRRVNELESLTRR